MVSGTGIQAAVAFAANLVLVRLLLPEEFGRFAIIQANISLVGAVVSLKINDLLIREPEEELTGRRLGLYFGALTVQTVVVGVGATLLLWALDMLTWASGALLAAVLGSFWVNAQLTLYERRFEYEEISVIETSAHTAGHLFAVVGAWLGLGALVLYLRQGVQVVGRLFGLRVVSGLRKPPLRWLSLAEWKLVFRKLRGFWADGVLARVFDRAVILLVGGLVGEQATGYFYQAHRLAATPNQLASPITERIALNYFSQRVARGRREAVVHRVLVLELCFLAVMAGFVWIVADPLIPWLFGSDWRPVVPLFRAMVGMIMGMTLINTLNSYYMAAGNLRPFIVLGRGGQFLGLGIGLAVAAVPLGIGYDLGVSLGLSAAYVIGVAGAWRFMSWQGH